MLQNFEVNPYWGRCSIGLSIVLSNTQSKTLYFYLELKSIGKVISTESSKRAIMLWNSNKSAYKNAFFAFSAHFKM